jgi:hypothetical protein
MGLIRIFRISFLAVILIVPFVCSYLTLSVLEGIKATYGFSGVVFAVYGILLSGVSLKMVFERKDEIVSMLFLIFLVIYGFLVKTYERTPTWWAGYISAIFVVIPMAYLIVKYRRDYSILKKIMVAVTVTCIAFSFLLEGISPYIILRGMNSLAHYTGLLCGISFPYIFLSVSHSLRGRTRSRFLKMVGLEKRTKK